MYFYPMFCKLSGKLVNNHSFVLLICICVATLLPTTLQEKPAQLVIEVKYILVRTTPNPEYYEDFTDEMKRTMKTINRMSKNSDNQIVINETANFKFFLKPFLVKLKPTDNILRDLVNKIKRFRAIEKELPHFIISDIIDQKLALIATEFNLPLIGCPKGVDIPRGMGIKEPLWVSAPYFLPYETLIKFSLQKRHSKTIVFLADKGYCPKVLDILYELYYDAYAMTIDTQNDINQFSNKRNLNSTTMYICVSHNNENFTVDAINTINKNRPDKAILLLPYELVGEIDKVLPQLRRLVLSLESYFSVSMDKSTDYKNNYQTYLMDSCVTRSAAYVFEILSSKQWPPLCNWNEMHNKYHARPSCLSSKESYIEKIRRFNQIQKVKRKDYKTGIPLRFGYSLLTINEKFGSKFALKDMKGYQTDTADEPFQFLKHEVLVNTRIGSPYVMFRDINGTDDCSNDWGMLCSLITSETTDGNTSKQVCCFGIAIDILKILVKLKSFAISVGIPKARNSTNQHLFTDAYKLDIIVRQAISGTHEDKLGFSGNNQSLNRNPSLVDLAKVNADIAVGPEVIISSENLKKSYLTRPYFNSAIGIMMKSTRDKMSDYAAITAFMAPFDWSMWFGIFVTIHIAAFATVIYEWHSPFGLTPRGRNRTRVFSLSSALTLCWSVLFSHTVATKSPKCWSSRFLMNVYACFCLVFLASYTANLAAYMVEKSWTQIVGIHDNQIQNGNIRIGTVLGSGTELYLRKAQPQLYKFALLFLNVEDAINGLKNNRIDAFVYDMESLQFIKCMYLKNKFEIVGKPFAQVSYTVAISKSLKNYGKTIADLLSEIIAKEGFEKYMEQKVKLWTRDVTGTVQNSVVKSYRLKTENFAGPLLLLCSGIILALLTLCCEGIVYKLVLPCLRKINSKEWALPVSQRLFRHLHAEPNYNKYTFTERHIASCEMPVAERLSHYRRMSKLLQGPSSYVYWKGTADQPESSSCLILHSNSNPTAPQFLSNLQSESQSNTPQADRSNNSSQTPSMSDSEFMVPLNNHRQQSNNYWPPCYTIDTNIKSVRKDPGCSDYPTLPNFQLPCLTTVANQRQQNMSSRQPLLQAEHHELHNIAVQTEIEALVNDRLVPVDTNITMRTNEFERDMRAMREQIAQLMYDKEKLILRLAAYEGRSRSDLEVELKNLTSAATAASMTSAMGVGEVSTNKDNGSEAGATTEKLQSFLTCKNSW